MPSKEIYTRNNVNVARLEVLALELHFSLAMPVAREILPLMVGGRRGNVRVGRFQGRSKIAPCRG